MRAPLSRKFIEKAEAALQLADRLLRVRGSLLLYPTRARVLLSRTAPADKTLRVPLAKGGHLNAPLRKACPEQGAILLDQIDLDPAHV